MTFQTDAQQDAADIINGEFSEECIHTPRNGVPQTPFNCLGDFSQMHGDEVKTRVVPEAIAISVLTSEVTAIKKRDFILVAGTNFEVINNPIPVLTFLGMSAINLRTERTRKTKI